MIPWLQLELTAGADGRLQVHVSGSTGGRATAAQTVGVTVEQLASFGGSVQHIAAQGQGLPSQLEQWTRGLYQGVMHGEAGQVLNRLIGQGEGEVLIKLMVSDPTLRAVPWEAMKGPTDADPALALNSRVRVVRGVHSTEEGDPREVRGAVRVLAVAPQEMAYAVRGLEEELAGEIEAGRVEWLEPTVGTGASWKNLVQRLQRGPWPHILHIIAHGRVHDGKPQVLLEDTGGAWTDTEVLAQALTGKRVSDELRLVYLESCQGGDAGAHASSAERLARSAADAVVAHLWTADAKHARTAALQFYGALVDTANGDVAAALSLARLALAGTAEALCPVLYLRGNQPTLFNFNRRKLRARPRSGPGDNGGGLTPDQQKVLDDLRATLEEPCTVFIGERVGPQDRPWGGQDLRTKLLRELELDEAGRFEPLPQLLQRYELMTRRRTLEDLVQDVLDPLFDDDGIDPGLLDGLCQVTGPGLIVTQLWVPVVEETLARKLPDTDIVVLQPQDPSLEDRMQVFRRKAGETRFRPDDDGIRGVDFTTDRVVLRLYGGYQASNHRLRGQPVLTDDDRLRNLVEVGNLPRAVLAFVRHHPMVVLGLSPVRWSDRQLLQGLVGEQPMRRGSLAFVTGTATESDRAYWSSESGPAGRSGRIGVYTQTDLAAALRAGRPS